MSDCLRTSIRLQREKQYEQEFCQCGIGQWCGCANCNETSSQLLSGERDQTSWPASAHLKLVTGERMRAVGCSMNDTNVKLMAICGARLAAELAVLDGIGWSEPPPPA